MTNEEKKTFRELGEFLIWGAVFFFYGAMAARCLF